MYKYKKLRAGSNNLVIQLLLYHENEVLSGCNNINSYLLDDMVEFVLNDDDSNDAVKIEKDLVL